MEPSPRLADEPGSEPVFSGGTTASQPTPNLLWASVPTPATIALLVWLVGAAVMCTRLGVGHRRMTRLRAMAVPAEAGTEAICRELAVQMRVGTPAVLRSPFLFSPCLDGLRRPAILLPDDVGENLRETFIHELAPPRTAGRIVEPREAL